MVKELEHPFYEGRLRELGGVQPGVEKALGKPRGTFQYLKGADEKDGKKLLSRGCCNRMRGNGFKLEKG